MPTPNKWVYAVLVLFVLFFIWSDPNGAGSTGRVFVDWVGDIILAIFDFLDGLLGPETPSGTSTDPAIQEPAPGTTPVPADEFNDNP